MELSRYVESKNPLKLKRRRHSHLFSEVRGEAPNGGKQMRHASQLAARSASPVRQWS